MEVLIQNVRIIDPSQGLDQVGDLLLKGGKVAQIGKNLPVSGTEERVDGTGLVAAPGLVDMHVHLRDPGLTHKEDVFSGCRAAAAGGVTSLLAMPNTKPAMDTPETVRALLEKAKDADAGVYTAACITQGLQGDALTDLEALREAGAIALSDDGRPVVNTRCLLDALEQASELGMTVTAHCEDLYLAAGGLMNEGEVSRKLGVPGIPEAAEDCGTAREIAAAASIGAPIHICHVSTKGSVELIRDAKARGVKVTAETCPHYLLLTEQALETRDADYRMNPPLRREEDRLALIEGLKDGTLDDDCHGSCTTHTRGEEGFSQGSQWFHRNGDLFGSHSHSAGGKAVLGEDPGKNELEPCTDSGDSCRHLEGGSFGRCGVV